MFTDRNAFGEVKKMSPIITNNPKTQEQQTTADLSGAISLAAIGIEEAVAYGVPGEVINIPCGDCTLVVASTVSGDTEVVDYERSQQQFQEIIISNSAGALPVPVGAKRQSRLKDLLDEATDTVFVGSDVPVYQVITLSKNEDTEVDTSEEVDTTATRVELKAKFISPQDAEAQFTVAA